MTLKATILSPRPVCQDSVLCPQIGVLLKTFWLGTAASALDVGWRRSPVPLMEDPTYLFRWLSPSAFIKWNAQPLEGRMKKSEDMSSFFRIAFTGSLQIEMYFYLPCLKCVVLPESEHSNALSLLERSQLPSLYISPLLCCTYFPLNITLRW